MKVDLKYKKNIIIEIIENIDDVQVINFLFKWWIIILSATLKNV